jgi:transposase
LISPRTCASGCPAGRLVWFVSDVADSLDLAQVMRAYEKHELRGRPGYHPPLMVKLLLYAYCVGKPSSRKIEKATWEELPFRVLAADQHPDHASIAAFRRRHLAALSGLFLQVLTLCRKAGLVQLGHVALDGAKLRANALRHKAMSYARLCAAEEQLAGEVAELLREAERAAAEARERVRARKANEAKRGKRYGGRPPVIPDPETAKPAPREQKNFTDPESRIMVDGASGSYVQAYNAHAAVDARLPGHRGRFSHGRTPTTSAICGRSSSRSPRTSARFRRRSPPTAASSAPPISRIPLWRRSSSTCLRRRACGSLRWHRPCVRSSTVRRAAPCMLSARPSSSRSSGRSRRFAAFAASHCAAGSWSARNGSSSVSLTTCSSSSERERSWFQPEGQGPRGFSGP